MVAFVAVDVGREGETVRVPKGTAFFVEVPINDRSTQSYVVTAAHVVDGARAAGSMYLRLNLPTGDYEDVPSDPDAWVTSPTNDIAVARFDLPRSRYVYTAYPLKWFLTPAESAERNVGNGDDLFFVGLFTQHPGRVSAQPIVRFGNIALMPGEPIKMKYPDGTKAERLAYLVEARSWGGNSGSPCFVYFPAHRYGGVWSKPIEVPLGGAMTDELYIEATMPRLLGVVVGHFNLRQDLAFAYDETSSEDLTVNSGMAIVVPVDEVMNVLMDEPFLEERRMQEKKQEDAEPAAIPDSADEPASEFERFEDLTRKVVNVPKEAIDEKRKDG